MRDPRSQVDRHGSDAGAEDRRGPTVKRDLSTLES